MTGTDTIIHIDDFRCITRGCTSFGSPFCTKCERISELASAVADDASVATEAPVSSPQPAGASVATFSSLAKEPEANACSAKGGRRRVRVGESGAGLTATSEFMGVTAGETASNSVSDDAANCSLPSGESEPSVTLALVSSEFNSGDGLGVHKPGSHTWGGDLLATAPSGRADDSAKCPAVTGSLPVVADGTAARQPSLGVSSLDLAEPASVGSALSFEDEVSAREADGTLGLPSLAPRAIDMNEMASRKRAYAGRGR